MVGALDVDERVKDINFGHPFPRFPDASPFHIKVGPRNHTTVTHPRPLGTFIPSLTIVSP